MSAEWILIEYQESNKTIARAICFDEVRTITAGSRLVGTKLKRSFVLEFKDGSVYEIPDDAKTVVAPTAFRDLLAELSQVIKV